MALWSPQIHNKLGKELAADAQVLPVLRHQRNTGGDRTWGRKDLNNIASWTTGQQWKRKSRRRNPHVHYLQNYSGIGGRVWVENPTWCLVGKLMLHRFLL